ncbi:MAG: hypothetical protein R3E68_11085 [Burkholderiaceae bacterium]
MLGWTLLFAIGLAGALVLAGRHLLLPHLDRFAPRLEMLVSERLGVPVRIESLRGHLDGLKPALEIGALRIADGELFEVRGLAAVLDWRSLWLLQPVFERLHVDSLAVRIERLGPDHWQVAGRDIRPGAGPVPSDGRWPLPPWLLESSDLHVRQITLDYRDRETGERAVSTRMSLDSTGRRGTRQLRIDAPELKGPGGHFTLRARLGRDERLAGLVNRNWFGDAYFEYTGFDVGALVRLLRRPVPIDEGLLHAQGWFKLHDNRPRSARLALTATDLRMSVDDVEAVLPTARADLETLWQGNGDLELRLRDARATDRTGTEIALGEGRSA